jgi:hypothetical protein
LGLCRLRYARFLGFHTGHRQLVVKARDFGAKLGQTSRDLELHFDRRLIHLAQLLEKLALTLPYRSRSRSKF